MSLSPDYSAAGASLYCGEDAGEVASWVADTWISHYPPTTSLSAADSPPSDESTVSMLIDSEPHHAPHPDYLRRCRDRSIDITARQDSINWILKVRTLSPTYQNTYMYNNVYVLSF
jgi:cyclin D1/2/4